MKVPALIQRPDGQVVVIGAQAIDSATIAEREHTTPTISDRPVPLPGADTDQTPKDENRPKNLLSR